MNKTYPVVPHSEFSSVPWDEEECSFTIKAFGVGMVIKSEIDNEDGKRDTFSLYEPSYEKIPPEIVITEETTNEERNESLRRHLFLTSGLIHKNGTLYERSGEDYLWPRGVAAAPLDDEIPKLWKTAQSLRIKEIVNIVFPESKKGYLSGSEVIILHPSRINVYFLDDASNAGLPLDTFVGWKVYHCMHGTGTFVKLKNGSFAARWRMQCGKEGCKKRVTIYTKSGCHKGAFCYVCDKEGKYLADLRNQYIVCNDHS